MWNNLLCAESKWPTGVTTLSYLFEVKVTYLHPSVPVQFYLELVKFLPRNMPMNQEIIIK